MTHRDPARHLVSDDPSANAIETADGEKTKVREVVTVGHSNADLCPDREEQRDSAARRSGPDGVLKWEN